MVQNVGIASDSTFGWNDLIADSDAYLMAHQSLGSSSGLSRLSRDLFALSPADRVAEFYALRFGSNPDNVAVAFAEFADGLDAGPIEDVPTWLTDWAVLDVADADRLPTSTEAKTCGRAYAHVMATLGT